LVYESATDVDYRTFALVRVRLILLICSNDNSFATTSPSIAADVVSGTAVENEDLPAVEESEVRFSTLLSAQCFAAAPPAGTDCVVRPFRSRIARSW